jgi:hypothetical protein
MQQVNAKELKRMHFSILLRDEAKKKPNCEQLGF